LYGPERLIRAGVVHVTSAVRTAGGPLRVIAIGAGAPRSATDFFVLNLCRARCDGLLTTAAILRSEPGVVHTLQGPWAAALSAYRREVLGKHAPPVCAIMTRSAELPLEHPVWRDGTDKLLLTTPEAAAGLRASLGSRAEVVPVAGLDARRALDALRARGLELISVEAGPSTTGSLYEPPSAVDELLLSLYDGAGEAIQLGGALSPDLLRERVATADTKREEESGSWRFQRWLRAGQH
jgi:riboflavin biosynthesis pyrimidine reductase